ncbi:hypothetical protein GGF50DRAFT_122247 [Schizophyllum commune]
MSLNSSPIQQGSAPQPAGFWSFPWPDPQLDRPAVDNAIAKARKMAKYDPLQSIAMIPPGAFVGPRHQVLYEGQDEALREVLSRMTAEQQHEMMLRYMIRHLAVPPASPEQLALERQHLVEAHRLMPMYEAKLASAIAQVQHQKMINGPAVAPALEEMNLANRLYNTNKLKARILTWRSFPIQELPADILEDIFRLAVYHTRGPIDLANTRGTLAAVCRSWRNIINADPTLWNTIRIFEEHPWSMTALQVERSSGTFLDIRVDDEEREQRGLPLLTGEKWTSLIDILFSKLSQIRMFIVTVKDMGSMFYLIDRLRAAKGQPMMLQRLELFGGGQPYMFIPGADFEPKEYQQPMALFDGYDIPSLTHLTLKGVQIDWANTNLSNLTTFDIRRFPPERSPSILKFREILSNCPNLENLTIDAAAPIPAQNQAELDATSTPVELPNLKRLTVADLVPETAIALFKQFNAPGIKELTVLNLSTDDYGAFLETTIGSLSNVRILTWYSCEVRNMPENRRIMARWFKAMPKLCYMRLAGVDRDTLDFFLMDEGIEQTGGLPFPLSGAIPQPKPILPNLLAIEWENCHAEDIAYFVRRRKAMGRPLRHVYTYQPYWDQIKNDPETKELLDEAREIMAIAPMSSEQTREEAWALSDDRD